MFSTNTNTMKVTTMATKTTTYPSVRFLYRNEFKRFSCMLKQSFKCTTTSKSTSETQVQWDALVLPLVLSTLCTLPIYNYKRRITDTKIQKIHVRSFNMDSKYTTEDINLQKKNIKQKRYIYKYKKYIDKYKI